MESYEERMAKAVEDFKAANIGIDPLTLLEMVRRFAVKDPPMRHWLVELRNISRESFVLEMQY